jgi:A/G-specific adenine glycosylase
MAVLRDTDGPVHLSRVEAVWPDDTQRERCLAGLIDDRLIVAAGPSAYALPS